MRPANRPITIPKGDTYQHLVTFTDAAGDPVDVSANTYAAQVRRYPDDPEPPLAAMDVNDVAADAGAIWLTIDAPVTAALNPGRFAWDLEETDIAGLVTTIMGGHADVLPDVTRPIV